MQAKDMIRHALAIATVLFLAQATSAQPSAEECDDDGGATICVRFENLADPPEEGTDFTFGFADPDRPTVILITGSDESTTREWWVWSHDGAGEETRTQLVSSSRWHTESQRSSTGCQGGRFARAHVSRGR